MNQVNLVVLILRTGIKTLLNWHGKLLKVTVEHLFKNTSSKCMTKLVAVGLMPLQFQETKPQDELKLLRKDTNMNSELLQSTKLDLVNLAIPLNLLLPNHDFVSYSYIHHYTIITYQNFCSGP